MDTLAQLGLGDMIPDLEESLKERVNKLGARTRVLLSSGILPVPMLLQMAEQITTSAREGDLVKLEEIEEHVNLGLRVAADQFPFSGCETCESLPECQGAMEGIEKITPEEAMQLMAELAPTIGNA